MSQRIWKNKGIAFDSELFEFDLGLILICSHGFRYCQIYYIYKFSFVLNASEIHLYPDPFWFPGIRLLESRLFSKSPVA